MEESRPAAEPVESQDPRQTPKSSTAKLRRLQAVLLSLRPSPLFDLASSHRQPDVSEQNVVARSANTRAAELFVPGILQPDAGVEPRPPRRKTAHERDVSYFRNPTFGIHTQKRAAPSVEILPGQHHPVVVAIRQGCVGSRFAEFISKSGGTKKIKAGVE